MANYAYLQFNLPDLAFLPFFYVRYSSVQLASSWTSCRPHTEEISSFVSILHKNLSEMEIFPIGRQLPSTTIYVPSAPILASTT